MRLRNRLHLKTLFSPLFFFLISSQNYFHEDQFPYLAILEPLKNPASTACGTEGILYEGFGGCLPLDLWPKEIHVKSQPYL